MAPLGFTTEAAVYKSVWHYWTMAALGGNTPATLELAALCPGACGPGNQCCGACGLTGPPGEREFVCLGTCCPAAEPQFVPQQVTDSGQQWFHRRSSTS